MVCFKLKFDCTFLDFDFNHRIHSSMFIAFIKHLPLLSSLPTCILISLSISPSPSPSFSPHSLPALSCSPPLTKIIAVLQSQA